MKTILTFADTDMNAPADTRDRSGYKHRQAARAVVTDEDGRVALLHVGKYGYYKLPGGGIDEGETIEEALKRELIEEIGCQVEAISEIGVVVEFRDKSDFMQTSYAFTARKVGEQMAPDFTDKELNDGFEIVWAADLSDALALVHEAQPVLYEAGHIKKRDGTILEAAR